MYLRPAAGLGDRAGRALVHVRHGQARPGGVGGQRREQLVVGDRPPGRPHRLLVRSGLRARRRVTAAASRQAATRRGCRSRLTSSRNQPGSTGMPLSSVAITTWAYSSEISASSTSSTLARTANARTAGDACSRLAGSSLMSRAWNASVKKYSRSRSVGLARPGGVAADDGVEPVPVPHGLHVRAEARRVPRGERAVRQHPQGLLVDAVAVGVQCVGEHVPRPWGRERLLGFGGLVHSWSGRCTR